MTDKRGWGTTVLGWFVVQDAQTAEETPSDSPVDESATDHALSPATPDSPAAPPATDFFQTPPPAATGGQVDFDAVFESAGVDAEERGRVARAAELLRSLPAGTDAAVKKQIVEASLRAFGVPVEKIIEAGAEEIQALEFYIRAGAGDTETLINESERRIREYEEEIKTIRLVMQERVQEQQAVIKLCNEKKLEVQQILEFFGQDRVAAVVKASPKLHDPSGSSEGTSAQ
jgi:hypothetical protein